MAASLTLTKCLAVAAFIAVSVIGFIVPLRLRSFRYARLLSLLNCFSAGFLFGLGLLHMLAEGAHLWDDAMAADAAAAPHDHDHDHEHTSTTTTMNDNNSCSISEDDDGGGGGHGHSHGGANYPFPFLCAALGYLVILIVEKLAGLVLESAQADAAPSVTTTHVECKATVPECEHHLHSVAHRCVSPALADDTHDKADDDDDDDDDDDTNLNPINAAVDHYSSPDTEDTASTDTSDETPLTSASHSSSSSSSSMPRAMPPQSSSSLSMPRASPPPQSSSSMSSMSSFSPSPPLRPISPTPVHGDCSSGSSSKRESYGSAALLSSPSVSLAHHDAHTHAHSHSHAHGGGADGGGTGESPTVCAATDEYLEAEEEQRQLLQSHHVAPVLLNDKILAAVLTIALSIHAVVFGISMGVQSSTSELLAILAAVILHKALEAVALGIAFAKVELERVKMFIVGAVYTLSTPVGVALGVVIKNEFHGAQSLRVQAIVVSIAAGTFMFASTNGAFVSEFERSNAQSNSCRRRHRRGVLANCAAIVAGFAVAAVLTNFMG